MPASTWNVILAKLQFISVRSAKSDHTTLVHWLRNPFRLSPATPLRYAQDRLRPQGEVDAGARLDLPPFDFAALRSGRAGKYPTVGEEVYESSVVRFRTRGVQKMQENQLSTFGPDRVDPHTEQLWRGKQEVRLTGKAAAVLRHLVERAGQVVTKEELFQTV